MILSTFKATVEKLGNSMTIDDAELFINSVNRGLRRIYTDFPITREIKIARRSVKPIFYQKEIFCKNGQVYEFPLNGAAFSLRFHGRGKYMITDGDNVHTFDVESPYEAKVIKGFVSYGGTIAFWGSFSFTIYNFAVYDDLLSANMSDIPEEGVPWTVDLKQTRKDFLSFVSLPTDLKGNPIDGCKLYDGKVELPEKYSGELKITYRRLPTLLAGTSESQVIDVTDEYLYLLILLTASNYWYFIDTSLAERYETLYKEGVERMTNTTYTTVNPEYINTDGWA
ncbi:MAG: hypothetical protein IJX58_02525 [Clostridia bacterium]|nr:hypothetical protein [Clostridia bacterium]